MNKQQLLASMGESFSTDGSVLLANPTWTPPGENPFSATALLIRTTGVFVVGFRLFPEQTPGEHIENLSEAVSRLSRLSGIPEDYFIPVPVHGGSGHETDTEISADHAVSYIGSYSENLIEADQLDDVAAALSAGAIFEQPSQSFPSTVARERDSGTGFIASRKAKFNGLSTTGKSNVCGISGFLLRIIGYCMCCGIVEDVPAFVILLGLLILLVGSILLMFAFIYLAKNKGYRAWVGVLCACTGVLLGLIILAVLPDRTKDRVEPIHN